MRIYSSEFLAALGSARDTGIAPVYFAHFVARDRATGDPVSAGFWSGDEDLSQTVPLPGGGTESRSYVGGCNLELDGLQYVGDLTDNPVTIRLSQIAPAAQELIRGHDLRLARCQIHATSWAGGAFVSTPQLLWVGVVDDGPISTPAAGSEGGISLTIRSEIMAQLGAVNPAKSSHEHQRRRLSTDDFCKNASTVSQRNLQWMKRDD